MNVDLTITVHGTAAPQGSKRALGPGRMIESSARVAPWRTDVREAAIKAMAEQGWACTGEAVEVSITCWLPRPKSHYRTGRNAALLRDGAPAWPTGRNTGDADKLARAMLDALTSAGVWADDSQVTGLQVSKSYAPGVAPQTFIRVRRVGA